MSAECRALVRGQIPRRTRSSLAVRPLCCESVIKFLCVLQIMKAILLSLCTSTPPPLPSCAIFPQTVSPPAPLPRRLFPLVLLQGAVTARCRRARARGHTQASIHLHKHTLLNRVKLQMGDAPKRQTTDMLNVVIFSTFLASLRKDARNALCFKGDLSIT